MAPAHAERAEDRAAHAGFLPTSPFYILPFLFVLALVVTIHELGHFLAAKALGVAIDRSPSASARRSLTGRDKSGVEWRLGWLPLGGYVRFAGDEDAASVPDQDDLAGLRRESGRARRARRRCGATSTSSRSGSGR